MQNIAMPRIFRHGIGDRVTTYVLVPFFLGVSSAIPADRAMQARNTKPLLSQLILQLDGKIAGFFVPPVFSLWDFIRPVFRFQVVGIILEATRRCTVERMNIFPLRCRDGSTRRRKGWTVRKGWRCQNKQDRRDHGGFHGLALASCDVMKV